jgi:L-ascorbate metabolism protein UlaG (beta-lactamase superfamily)
MPISIKWFPPSWVKISNQNKRIYIDPAYLKTYFQNYPKRIEYSSWPDPIDGLPEELQKADLILVTHHHKDHCKRITLERLKRPETVVIAPERCVRELGGGIKTMKPGENIQHDDVIIKAVHAHNIERGNSTRKKHKKGEGLGYLITVAGKTIYHAGDTDFIPEMRKLGMIWILVLPSTTAQFAGYHSLYSRFNNQQR